MKNYLYILSLLLLTSCYSEDSEHEKMFKVVKTVYKKGDDSSYSKKDIDINNWTKDEVFTNGDEIYWIRKYIEITKTPSKFQTIGVLMQAFGAYEVFWDGNLIGINDEPGLESTSEKTGAFLKSYVIPNDLLSIGNHTLALRASMFYKNDENRDFFIHISNYENILREPLLNTILINILTGAFLVAFIYCLLLYINDRKKYELLLFSIASLLFFLLAIIEYLKFYIPIHYSNFSLRLQIIGVLILFISFLVPYYFSVQFTFKYRKYFILIYTLLLLSVFIYFTGHYDYTALVLGQMMWISSTIVIIFAIYKKQKSAIVILIGLILSFIVYKSAIYDVSLFVSFAIILLCMFYILSLRTKEQRIAYENSLVQSTRLKLELLKKSIQPHFLMNTLTSLIDWVEEAPDKGVLFIEALADEFDVLNQVENETLIPISQEIQLCKSHINIMRFRKEIDYIWEDEGVNENIEQLIPPAVIHTLLENSITHCLPLDENKMRFKLIAFTTSTTQEYTFLTFGKIRNQKKSTSDGTGFKYIKARLTESYGDKWTFTSCRTNGGWKNTITIQK